MDTIKIKSNGRGKRTASKGTMLDGDLVTGDTFPARDYLKTYCDAKWDAERKGWIVNVEKLMALLNTPGAMLSIDK